MKGKTPKPLLLSENCLHEESPLSHTLLPRLRRRLRRHRVHGVHSFGQLLPDGLVHHPLPLHRLLPLERRRDNVDLDVPAVAARVADADQRRVGLEGGGDLQAHGVHELGGDLASELVR